MTLQTDYAFELPKGFIDVNGERHNKGIMRLATAADEIMPLKDPRVQQNPGYLSILLLARVITKLGTLEQINTKVIENLFTTDLAYLQDFYQRINTMDEPKYECRCPNCDQLINVPIDFMSAG